MDQSTAETRRRTLDRVVGEWTMSADPPWPGAARVRFVWLGGEAS